MKKIRIGRKKISIQIIGEKRFWIGVFIGVFSAIVITLFLKHSRESLRFFTSLSADLYIPTQYESKIYSIFLSLISSTIGFSISLWFWLGKQKEKSFREKRYSRFAQTYILLIIWVTIFMISRFGTVIYFVVFGVAGYDNDLNFATDNKLLLILIPAVIFLQSWFIVRLIYKSGKWILFSFAFTILFAIVLSYTITINREIVNKPYHNLYKTEYAFIDSQTIHLKEKYNISLEKKTIEILKKNYTQSSIDLVEQVKKVFSNNTKVPIDTIIFERIIIHNLKEGKFRYGVAQNDWSFALPIEIYNQIIRNEPNNNKTKELFLILKEQIELWNSPRIEWNKFNKYTNLELKREFFLINKRYPIEIIEQLKDARNNLILNDEYKDYHNLLPVILNKKNN